MSGIFYILRTGCQWKALPRVFGAPSTVHDRFQEWEAAGVFARLWAASLLEYDTIKELDWQWQSVDGAMTKAPLGGEATGPNPTDRAKKGVKRSIQVDANGIPVGLAVDGANRPDAQLLDPTLASTPITRPRPTPMKPQNMCLDKGYDSKAIRARLESDRYDHHIPRRGEQKLKKKITARSSSPLDR
jgi:transposase